LPAWSPASSRSAPFGLLGGALDDAANQKELRIVASMQFGIDSLHTDTPVAEKIPKLSSAMRLLKPTRDHQANLADSVPWRRAIRGTCKFARDRRRRDR
jgi:hypothetical protein